jgi:hypothetical protein
MSSGLLTTNLGDQAQTIRLIAQDISALNYQQPFQVLGSLAVPSPLAALTTVPFVTGFSKYVGYILTSATTVAIAQNFSISGLPVNYVGTYTITGSCDWILTGATPTVTVLPIITGTMIISNDTTAPGLGSTATLVVTSPAATYSSGTALLKYVININLD